VPVPLPMPAVMNTMFAPASAALTCSRSFSQALRPAEGFAPAPSPASPSWMMLGASERLSAWRSVFTVMNSTPWTPRLIMWLTALPPAPPTPTTLMTAPSDSLSIISKLGICWASNDWVVLR
jgi:hypothetical protein